MHSWASHPDVEQLLACMLAMPKAHHSAAVAVLLDGRDLRAAQAISLLRASNKLDFGKQKWCRRTRAWRTTRGCSTSSVERRRSCCRPLLQRRRRTRGRLFNPFGYAFDGIEDVRCATLQRAKTTPGRRLTPVLRSPATLRSQHEVLAKGTTAIAEA